MPNFDALALRILRRAARGEVRLVDRIDFGGRAPGDPIPADGAPDTDLRGERAIPRYSPQGVALAQPDRGSISLAQACRLLGHRLQNGLTVSRRPRDDAQNIADSHLALERLGKLSGPRLDLPLQRGA